MTCPNKSSKSWKDLVEMQGEARSYYLWARYEGNVPAKYYMRESYSLQDPVTNKLNLKNVINKYDLRAKGQNIYISLGSENTRKLGKEGLESGLFKIKTKQIPNDPDAFEVRFLFPKKKPKTIRTFGEHESSAAISAMEKMGELFPKLKHTWIDPEDLNQSEHLINIDRINAFVRGDEVFLVRGRVNRDTAIEEALHPFVDTIYNQNRELFNALLNSARKSERTLYNSVLSRYGELFANHGYTKTDMQKEFVTQVLTKYFKNEEIKPSKTLGQLIMQALKWLAEAIKKAVKVDSDGKNVIKVDQLSPKMTYENLASLLNVEGAVVYTETDMSTTRYSATENNKDPYEPDDKFVRRYTTELKIKRAFEEREQLEQIKARAVVKQNNAQLNALNKLLNNNMEMIEFYQNVLKDEQRGVIPEKNISVTSAVGSTEFKTNKDYTAYKNFGTFMHNFLEEMQKKVNDPEFIKEYMKNNGNKQPIIADVFTEEMFEEVLEHSQETIPFEIEGLTNEVMFEMAGEIVAAVGGMTNVILLPELSIISEGNITDDIKTKIIGRIDLSLITDKGRVKVIDFKTKKVKSITFKTASGTPVVNDALDINENTPYVLRELATKRNIIDSNPQIVEFAGATRSTFDTWTAQLLMYKRMLAKAGLEVENTKIIAMLYETSDDDVYLAHMTREFEGNMYEATGSYFDFSDKPGGMSYSEVGKEEYAKTDRIISNFIRLPLTEEEELKILEEKSEFNMPHEDYIRLKKALDFIVSEELEGIGGKIETLLKELRQARKEKKDDTIGIIQSRIDNFKNRKETLESFKRNLEDNTKDTTSSVKTSLAITALVTDIENLYDIFSETAKTDLNNTANQKRLLELVRSMRSIKAVYDVVHDSLIATVNSETEENKHFTQRHPLFQQMRDLDIKISDMEAKYRQFSLNIMVKALVETLRGRIPVTEDGNFTGFTTRFQKIDQDAKEALEKKLENKKTRLQHLKDTGKVPIGNKFKLGMTKFLDKGKYEELLEGLPLEKREQELAAAKLEEEIAHIEAIVNGGYNFDEETMKKYITGVTDKSSRMYIGKTDRSVLNAFGFTPDSLIAGASNSEIAISGLVQYLKNAQNESQVEWLNDTAKSNLQQKLDEFKKGRSDEQMNDMVVEERTTTRRKKNGDVVENTTLTYVKPTSQEYDNKLNYFNDHKKIMNENISNQKKVINSLLVEQRNAMSTGDTDTINSINPKLDAEKATLRTLVQERENLNKQEIEWFISNSATRFKPDFYNLMSKLPSELQSRLQDKYLELDLIRNLYGKGNEAMMTEEDYDQMRSVEIEIKKIRQEAAKSSPGALEAMRELERKYFEYKLNERQFNSVYNQKKELYVNNPKALKEWEKHNLVTVPSPEYYKELSDIFDELADLSEPDATLDRLREEIRELMSPYKTEERFDPTYMPEDERIQLAELLEEKAEYLELLSEDTTRTSEERYLFRKLGKLQANGVSPIYVEQKNEQLDRLKKARSLYKTFESEYQKSLTEEGKQRSKERLIQQEKNFNHISREFIEWFNKNHQNKVSTNLDLLDEMNEKELDFGDFNLYWREKVPAKAEHYVQKPAKKWYSRRLRIDESTNEPVAYNKDYQELPDGTPLPKGLKINENGEIVITDNNANINSKYVALTKDKAAFEYYKAFTDMFFSQQKKTTGNVMGYKVPGLKASFIENVKRKGLGELIKNESAKIYDNLFAVSVSQEDLMTNYYGDLGTDSIRFRFNEQYDRNLQTEDGINAGIQWMLESYINKAMADVQPVSDIMLDTVREQIAILEAQEGNSKEINTRIKELNTVLEQMKFERDKFVSGKFESFNDPNVRRVKKFLNSTFKYVALSRLGFDAATQIKNWASGSVQMFLASSGSNHYNDADLAKAQARLSGIGENSFWTNYMKDWGKFGNLSLPTLLYRAYNPVQKDFYKYLEATTGTKSRRALEKMSFFEMAYMMQDKGDTEIAIKTWLAIMEHYRYPVVERYENDKPVYKLDDEGNVVTVPAIEAYEKAEDGSLRIRGDVDMTVDDERFIKNAVYSEVRRAQGNYARADMEKAQSTLFGSLMFFFKKYLMPHVLNRVGSLRPNWEGSEMSMGYWKALWEIYRQYGIQEAMKATFLGGWTTKVIGDKAELKVSPFYQKKAAHARRDLLAGTVLTIATFFIFMKIKSITDDGEEIPMLAGTAARVIGGVKQETAALTPVPGIGSFDDYIRNFFTISNVVTDARKALKAVEHLGGLTVYYGYGKEMPDPEDDSVWAELYRRNVYQRKVGLYEKNTPKVIKDFHDLSGYKNIRDLFDPSYRLEIMSRYN